MKCILWVALLHVSVSDELAEEGNGAEDEEDPDHAVQPVLPVHPVPDTVDRRLLLHGHYQDLEDKKNHTRMDFKYLEIFLEVFQIHATVFDETALESSIINVSIVHCNACLGMKH